MTIETAGLVDIERRELIELSQFVLNRGTENVREELHEYLVEIALYNSDQEASATDIKSLIEKEFDFSAFPLSLVNPALARMGKKLISKGTPSKYLLATTRRKELTEMFKRQRLLRSHFIARVLSTISNKYGDISDVANSQIVKCLFKFLGIVFNNLSINLARLISEVPTEVKSVIELLETQEALEKTFEELDDKILSRISVKAITHVIEEYDEKTARFLYALAQSYVLLQILNIDPECQALQKKLILSDMKVYLDTNIVINLLCEHAFPRTHETCVKIVKLTNQLGIKCLITRRTAKEIEKHLQTSDQEYQNMGTVPEHRVKKLLRYVQDEVIKEYWVLLQNNPGLKWEAFLRRLHKYSSILRKKYSVTIDDTVFDHIHSHPKFDELSKMIQEANPKKAPEVVEHDCFHLLLVGYLREQVKEARILPNRWFVTRDKSLALAEKVRIITEKKRPSSVLVDIWLQMIAPLLSPKVATEEASEVFSRCFSSDFVPSFPRIKLTLLAKLIGPCLDYRDLDKNEIMEIIGDTYLQEHMEKMSQKGVLGNYLTRKYISITEKKHQATVNRLLEERSELMMKLKKLEKETTTLKEHIEAEKHFGKYLVGGTVFIVVWIVTYIWILLPTIEEPYTACTLAVLISLIFGYLLGFKRYEWILQKFLDLIKRKT